MLAFYPGFGRLGFFDETKNPFVICAGVMENRNGGNKRKIGETSHPGEDNEDSISLPPNQIENYSSKRVRHFVGDNNGNNENSQPIKSIMNQIADGSSSLAVKALSIVLQHWIIPDLGCSFDPLAERLSTLKAEAYKNLMGDVVDLWDKLDIEFHLNYCIMEDKRFFLEQTDKATTKLINLQLESLLPLNPIPVSSQLSY